MLTSAGNNNTFFKENLLVAYCEIFIRDYLEEDMRTGASENVFMRLGKIKSYL